MTALRPFTFQDNTSMAKGAWSHRGHPRGRGLAAKTMDEELNLDKQLELIYSWLQGHFDNNCQYHSEKETGKDAGHDWVWSKFFAADVPKFGSHVLVARQGLHSTGQIYRQRIYNFQISSEEGCIVNQIYKLKDESWFEKAENDPSSVLNLDPVADAECVDGCEVYWTFIPKENRFHASTKEGTCRFESRFFPGKTIIATSDIFLSSTELWTQDRGVDTSGNKMYGFQSDSHHKLVRCEMYKGKTEYGDQSEEVSIHNQGGKTELRNGVTVKLEQAFNVGMNCKVLQLSLLSDGQEKPTGVALSNWNASTIGVQCNNMSILLVKV